MIAIVRLLVEIGLQSLRAHRAKSLIVGGLMAFGAFVVVISLALLDSVEKATHDTLVQSISGDFQIYDKNAKDRLALLGGFGLGSEDIGEVPSFEKLTAAVAQVENVATIVPMGIATASVRAPGDLDRALDDLRGAVRGGDQADIQAFAERVRNIAGILKSSRQKQALVDNSETAETQAIVDRGISEELWQHFAADPLPALDWLDTKLAPLGEQGSQFYLRLVGTDIPHFQKSFERVRIVEGEAVPPGTRGMLVGKSFLDRRLKVGVVMNLDTIQRELQKGQTIATSKVLQETVARTQRQSSRILTLLAPKDVPVVDEALRKAMQGGAKPGQDLQGLLFDFLALTDGNFAERYRIFYEVIAPRIQLYPFKVGDTITLSSFTKTGYIRSTNIKVYGIYAIEGMESSDVSSALSLVDLVSFRELYGQRTAAFDAELSEMKKDVGAAAVSREDAEAALFGDAAAVEVRAAGPTASASSATELAVQRGVTETFDPAEINKGLVLSAAVRLKDPGKLRATQEELQAAVDPLALQVVDWQQSTGILGQITLVVRAVLLVAIFILFLITTVILNNSLVMATLERVAEFGTLRAIGAQKGFVTAMVVFETAVLGAIAATLGALLGVGFITWLHHKGIPAPAELLQVIFGGPRLFPDYSVQNVVAGLIATLIVSVLATIYPARLATRVQPVVAMQGKE